MAQIVSLALSLAERIGKVAKCWSEWQDSNLRPLRPERRLPAGFCSVSSPLAFRPMPSNPRLFRRIIGAAIGGRSYFKGTFQRECTL
jgi:hypothetical protein